MSPPLPTITPLTLVASFLVVASLWIAKSLATRSRAKLPPGPPGIPLIGNAFQIPQHAPWEYYTELSKKYGDVAYISAFGQPIVVLSSFAANTSLLIKKASISSGRFYLTMVMDIVGWKSSFIFLDANPVWKAQRKLIHQFLGLPAMPLYHSMLESSSYGLVHRLVMGERDFTTEVTYTIAKLIMRMAYGVQIDSPDHIISRLSREASQHVEYSGELANFPVVNLFPILRFVPTWFPFANFRRIGAAWHKHLLTSVTMPFDIVKAEMAAGTAEPSFCTRSIENRPEGITDEDIKWASGSLYVASANTTMLTMETFVLAMITHPEVQSKAQAEIDRVIGTDRLPTLADREQLRYLDCIFKEVLRWHPAVPQGVPHRTTAASEYQGMFGYSCYANFLGKVPLNDNILGGWHIPKDTIVIPNTWAMSRDPKVYRSADDFIPERYEENPDLLDSRAYVFGFGRRICAGQAFAEQSTWIMMATLLSTVHMRPALDENGAEIEINQEFQGSGRAVSVSLPFRFEPRSPSLMTLLQESPEAQYESKA